jgi:hypothetical protein
MKKSDAEALLSDLVNHASALDNPAVAQSLNEVLHLSKALPGTKFEDAFKLLPTVAIEHSGGDGLTAHQCAEVLTPYAALVRVIGKSAVAVALEDAAVVLRVLGEARMDHLVLIASQLAMAGKGKTKAPKVPPNEQVISRYNKLLEEALGDDPGFSSVIGQLARDEAVSVDELIEIAKRFAAASTKTKAAAMKKIQSRHASLMTSRARSAATAGRVAG